MATVRRELRTPTMPKTAKKKTAKMPATRNFVENSQDFVGSYSHPVYGPLTVLTNGTTLYFQWSAYYGPLSQQAVSGGIERTRREREITFQKKPKRGTHRTLIVSQMCSLAPVTRTAMSHPSRGRSNSAEIGKDRSIRFL